ncbi:MAG TPA: NAD-dependent epimerase/dehydratase family protein [Bacteroidia bacterium]|nr:NAD-dependent epimerase/dehydratase family protein [Bacteroidia bacterium]
MILITGATGMIGAHIAFALTSQGKNVRAIKRPGASTADTEKIFRFYSADAEALLKKIEWVEGDVLDVFSLEEATRGVEQVYHVAAVVSFVPKERDHMVKVNGEGTANMINAAMEAGVKKFCHVSSVAALGRTINLKNINEDTWWKNDPANSWYAISKYAGEREAWRGIEEARLPDGHGMSFVIVNPAVVIGPGNPTRSSNAIFSLAKKGFSWYTAGSGGFVDARDVAAACVKLMESPVTNQRFVLNAKNMTYREFADKILQRFGHPPTSREVGPFLMSIMWRLEKFFSRFSGKTPRVTKESAAASREAASYGGQKITETIPFTYRDIDQTLDEVVLFYR